MYSAQQGSTASNVKQDSANNKRRYEMTSGFPKLIYQLYSKLHKVLVTCYAI